MAANPATPANVRQQTTSATNGNTTDALYVRAWPVTVVLTVATSGKVQFTASSYDKIAAGTATWVDWNLGTVTVNTACAAPGPITGVRGVSISGNITLELANLELR